MASSLTTAEHGPERDIERGPERNAERNAEPAARRRREVIEVDDLKTYFFTEDGITRAVDGVSFTVEQGETLGIVGESGCGKSVTALSIMGLVPPKIGRITGGAIRFGEQDLTTLDEASMRKIRGKSIAMIFQEPMTSLNPVLSIGHQIIEAVKIHENVSDREARKRAVQMLELVRIPDASRRLGDYPHHFSGGMRQRVMIAMALACNPRLLIADEPTTALDVTIQAQILKLMVELKERTDAAIMLITHDLGVVAETCQRVIVMYAGRKVEEASVQELFARPMHPYTRGLMASIPRREPGRAGRGNRLQEIPGMVPRLNEPLEGCPFAPRCAFAVDRCRREAPALLEWAPDHHAACFEVERVLAS